MMKVFINDKDQEMRLEQIYDLIDCLDLDYMKRLIPNIKIMIENREEELREEEE